MRRSSAIRCSKGSTRREEAAADAEGEAPETAAEDPDWFSLDNGGINAQSIAGEFDSSLENIYPDEPGTTETIGPDLSSQWKSSPGSGSPSATMSEGFDLEDFAVAARTLRDHAGEQISFAFADPATRLIAGELADGLDEAGYLRAEPGEIAERLGTSEAEVLDVLAVCQTFDPAGIFARDLCECLTMQLKARDRFDPAIEMLLANLDLLARRDFLSLRRLCAVDEEDLLDMVAEIRALDPRPGLAFSTGSTDTIVADVIVRPASDGSWQIELNAGRAAHGSWSTRSISRRSPAAPRTRPRRNSSPIACRAPTG